MTTLICSDKDQGLNGELTFQIASGNTGNNFRLDNNTLYVNSQLDHETASQYNLEIEVTDKGEVSKTVVAVVTIYVTAENEHTPVFQVSNYSVNVSEATQIGKESSFLILCRELFQVSR